MRRIVIIGAGIGGLVAAIRAARLGMDVVVVERDSGPPDGGAEELASKWDRRSVPQFRAAHVLSSSVHDLLATYMPEVLTSLAGIGAPVTNLFMLLCPPELQEPDDRQFTQLVARRAVLEGVLHRTAACEPGVELRTGTVVDGLTFDERAATPTVVGIRLAGGETLAADLVIDAGGRRSPVAAWLAEAGIVVEDDLEPSEVVYHSRHYRRLPDAPLPSIFVVGVRDRVEHVRSIGFPGDDDTYCLTLNTPSWDERTRDLRNEWAFEAVANLLPGIRSWVQPDQGVAISDVHTIVGASNRVRRPGGAERVRGLVSIGDALSTTNPENGWGATMAARHAIAACAAFTSYPDDLDGVARRYHELVMDMTTAVFAESAAIDRLRNRRWAGQDIDARDQETAERLALIEEGVQPALLHDQVLARAFLRRVNLIDAPSAFFDDPDLVRRAASQRERSASKVTAAGVTLADVHRAIAAARP